MCVREAGEVREEEGDREEEREGEMAVSFFPVSVNRAKFH